jgi:hypothetical protein
VQDKRFAKPTECRIEVDLHAFTFEQPAGQRPAPVQLCSNLFVLCDERLAGRIGVHDITSTQAASQADRPQDGWIREDPAQRRSWSAPRARRSEQQGP